MQIKRGRPKKVKEELKESIETQIEQAHVDLKKEAIKEKEAIKQAKTNPHFGKYYGKNLRYKYKDGGTCHVYYNKTDEIIDWKPTLRDDGTNQS
jgi:regulator of replication initiation timing